MNCDHKKEVKKAEEILYVKMRAGTTYSVLKVKIINK